MESTKIKIQLFGAFRDIEPTGQHETEIHLPLTAIDLKNILTDQFAGRKSSVDIKALIKNSALATEYKVLKDTDLITTKENLALLPPVCGG